MNTNKDYCVQNGGDCRNNPVQDTTDAAPAAVKQIDKETFEREMRKAQTMQSIDRDRAEYWHGVARGLRRAYHGERFGEPGEHAQWLALVNDADTCRRQRGRGYRDGLAGAGIVQQDGGQDAGE